MTATTYIGIVHEGRIQLTEPVDLPEGSEVYVVVPNLLDERQAQRKASRWLMDILNDAGSAAEMIERGERLAPS